MTGSLLPRVIGVIHLPRLPYTTVKTQVDVSWMAELASSEARALERIGFEGVLVENFGDKPYLKRVLDPLALSAMTVIVKRVVDSVKIPVGLNILRNSGREAYSIALTTGAKFIRVNALSETIISDSGVIEPEAPFMRDVRLNYPGVMIFADVLVKHAGSLTVLSLRAKETIRSRSLTTALKDILEDTVERGGADSVIVTGERTGKPPSVEVLKIIKKYSPAPVYVGSGASTHNIKSLMENADGVIVGSFIKKNGIAGNPLDEKRAEDFIRALREVLK
ncbi:MAG: BtpA/SgcQ family protein [Thermosphaera sp.]